EEILDSIKISFKYELPFEKRCWDEFWSKHQDVLKKIKENGVDIKEGMDKFVKWVDEMDVKHDMPMRVSNYTVYDLSWIDFYICTYTERPCIYYYFDGNKYINDDVLDTWSMFYGGYYMKVGKEKRNRLRALLDVESPTYENSHDSLEDAKKIAHECVLFIKKYADSSAK
ncbi:MAG: hypothetical protein ACYC56_08455, partial [Candidatus Aquicultor sp.]